MGISSEGNYIYSTRHWLCGGQPAYEWLVFANSARFNLWYQYTEANLVKIEVGTLCTPIPEPSSLVVLATVLSACGGLLLRRGR